MTVIRDTVDPDHWRSVGGLTHSMTEYRGTLIVQADAAAHRQIAALLHGIYAAQHDQPPDPADLDAYRRTVQRLRQPIDAELRGRTVPDALRYIRSQTEAMIMLPLECGYGLESNSTVDVNTRGRPIGDVLGEIVDAELGWGQPHEMMRRATRGDGIVAMIGASDGWATPIVRVYAVGDLVESDGRRSEDADSHVTERLGSLMQTLRGTVEPNNWRDAGGLQAAMGSFDTTLVVMAPPTMHDEIETRLADLRRLRDRYAGR